MADGAVAADDRRASDHHAVFDHRALADGHLLANPRDAFTAVVQRRLDAGGDVCGELAERVPSVFTALE